MFISIFWIVVAVAVWIFQQRVIKNLIAAIESEQGKRREARAEVLAVKTELRQVERRLKYANRDLDHFKGLAK